LWPLHINYALLAYNAHNVVVLRQFNMLPLTVQAGEDNCAGNKCSDIEAEVMR